MRTWTLTLSTTRGAWLSGISLLGLFVLAESRCRPPFPLFPTPSTSYRLVSQSQPYKANLPTHIISSRVLREVQIGQPPPSLSRVRDIGCQLEGRAESPDSLSRTSPLGAAARCRRMGTPSAEETFRDRTILEPASQSTVHGDQPIAIAQAASRAEPPP